jgi:hypothetical protein
MKPIIREEIRSTYTEILTIENIRCILGFSKRKVSWMLQNGVIKCKNSGKKTKQYRVKIDDLFEYLDKVEQGDPSIMTPVGAFTSKKNGAKNLMKAPVPPITFIKPPEDFRLWLEDEWYAESDLLLTQDIARITGYEHSTIQRWLKDKRIRSVRTQDALISTKTWLIDFYCEDAYQIIRKNDVHLDLMKKYYGIT